AEFNNSQDFLIGAAGQSATLNVLGGTNRFFNAISVAPVANSTGTVSVSGGQLIVTNSSLTVGQLGLGQMTVSNSTVRALNVNVGYNAARGVLTIADGALLFASQLLAGALTGGTGQVFVTGGQLLVTNGSASI